MLHTIKKSRARFSLFRVFHHSLARHKYCHAWKKMKWVPQKSRSPYFIRPWWNAVIKRREKKSFLAISHEGNFWTGIASIDQEPSNDAASVMNSFREKYETTSLCCERMRRIRANFMRRKMSSNYRASLPSSKVTMLLHLLTTKYEIRSQKPQLCLSTSY